MRKKMTPDSTGAPAESEQGPLVTVPIVIPAQWRDDLLRLAAVRSMQSGKAASRSALLREMLAPLMIGVRQELATGRDAFSGRTS